MSLTDGGTLSSGGSSRPLPAASAASAAAEAAAAGLGAVRAACDDAALGAVLAVVALAVDGDGDAEDAQPTTTNAAARIIESVRFSCTGVLLLGSMSMCCGRR